MLYLRAYLAELKSLEPSIDQLKAQLEPLSEALTVFKNTVPSDAEGLTVAQLAETVPQLRELARVMTQAVSL